METQKLEKGRRCAFCAEAVCRPQKRSKHRRCDSSGKFKEPALFQQVNIPNSPLPNANSSHLLQKTATLTTTACILLVAHKVTRYAPSLSLFYFSFILLSFSSLLHYSCFPHSPIFSTHLD